MYGVKYIDLVSLAVTVPANQVVVLVPHAPHGSITTKDASFGVYAKVLGNGQYSTQCNLPPFSKWLPES